MTLISFIIIALASDCLATFISSDGWSGPFNLLHKLRYVVGMRYNDVSELQATSVVAEALMCWVCGPIWISIVLIIPYFFWQEVLWLYAPFAVGGLVLNAKKE